MNIVAGTSDTPILDLLAPLPKPHGGEGRLRIILLLAVIFGAAAVCRDLRLLAVAFSFYLILLLATAIHELGHVAAGCAIGFKFESVRIGPISIRRESDRWKVKAEWHLVNGLTSMVPDRMCRVRRRLIIYIAAGPIAGFLSAVIAFEGLRLAIRHEDAFLSLVLAPFGTWSLLFSFGNLLPARRGRRTTDGLKLRALFCSKEGTRRLLAQYALTMQTRKGSGPYLLNGRWTRIVGSGEVTSQTFIGDWHAYVNAADAKTAAQCLERCLAACAFLNDEGREIFIIEAAIFMAWWRRDADKAAAWFERAAHPERMDPLVRVRAEAALNCVHGRFDDALQLLDRGFEIIQRFPPGGHKKRSETAWLEWRREIEQRRDGSSAS